MSPRRERSGTPGGAEPGTVYLVGAGPGDPGLVTVRARELVASADVILYDRLLPDGILRDARSDAELVYVGKAPGNVAMSQRDTELLMVEKAKAGHSVLRLKGGDPFVFGRGGEEAERLRAAGLTFEVVPGLTAGIAAPAYAGIPVTHRSDASAVALITGHEDPEKDELALDWKALAAFPGTLCFYMGVGNLPAIAERLIAEGRSPDEPAGVIRRGTHPDQETVTATLSTVADTVAEAALRPPAMICVGDVVARREAIRWFDERPLFGRRVVVTRARAQASTLVRRLQTLGAEVVEVPAIQIDPLIDSAEVADAIAAIGSYRLLCLTSANAVQLLFEALEAARADARSLGGVKVAAIGPGTAEALADRGIRADIVPPRFIAESLVETLVSEGLAGERTLIARAAEARDLLPDELRRHGATVDVVPLYRTLAGDPTDDQLAAARKADFVTFTSSSTVRNYQTALAGTVPEGPRVVSIGPVTSATAHELGIEVAAEAARHDIDGLLETLVDLATTESATVDAG
ncbi:MAG: uroporphyrinogen-III C-methyltransferase [Solirubrobacterales bacterium]